MYKILILEDDLTLLNILKQLLERANYLVDAARELERAKELIIQHDYDLLIFDRLIVGDDVLFYLEELRFDHYFIRILLISKKKLLSDRLMSLKVVDDFLAKPLVMSELLLKVKNLLSRSRIMSSCQYACSNFVLNDSGTVKNKINQKEVHLPKKERKILECLLIHQNQPVSYQSLINYVWDREEEYPQQRTLNVYVRRIRLKLGELGKQLKTVRDYGFILENKSGGC